MEHDQSPLRICPSCASKSAGTICDFCGMLTEEACPQCHEAKSNDLCDSALHPNTV